MSNEELKTIELRELQPLLSCTFGERLIVLRYTTDNLLPPGENFGSTILKVHAVIKRDDDAEEEDLHLVAKMLPPTEYQRRIFDSPYTFKKEIFMYEHILPHYQELEREAGLKEDELFDILPKYYQSRFSLSSDVEFDDNAVILMENLKTRGYYTGNRMKGYDLEHSRVAIRAMARFHALGMISKYKRPEYFEILKQHSKPLDFKTDEFKQVQKNMINKMAEDPQIAVHIDRCRSALFDTEVGLWTAVPDEPWSTIIHADFWVNNIMFHRDESGRVNDVKFVDFQNYLFFNPLRELVFFVLSSTNDDVHDEDIEELIDIYYETLLNVLKQMDCDTKLFTREKFHAKMANDAKYEFQHICFIMKIITLDVQETQFHYDKIRSVILSYQGNQVFIQRLRRIVLYLIKRNWI